MEDSVHYMLSTTKQGGVKATRVMISRTYMVSQTNAYPHYYLSEVKGLNRLIHLSIEPLVVQLTYP